MLLDTTNHRLKLGHILSFFTPLKPASVLPLQMRRSIFIIIGEADPPVQLTVNRCAAS